MKSQNDFQEKNLSSKLRGILKKVTMMMIVLLLAMSSPVLAELEVNNSMAQANRLTNGEVMPGAIQSKSDIDWFTFYSDGGVFTINTALQGKYREASGVMWVVTLFDQDNNELYAFIVHEEESISVDISLATPGNYYVLVKSTSTSSFHNEPYHLTVTAKNISGSPALAEIEVNNSMEQANRLADGEKIIGAILSNSDIDWFTFHSNGDVFTINTALQGKYREASGVMWIVALFDQDNNELYAFIVHEEESISVDISLATPGNYYVLVKSTSTSSFHNEPYHLTVTAKNISLPKMYYRDFDNDGFGDPNTSTESFSQPPGYISNNTDCNDDDATIYPGSLEICGDSKDNNCNGVIDEGCPADYTLGPYNYYLPFFKSGDNFWTGLGLANHNHAISNDLRVIVYDSTGHPLAYEFKTIPPYGQDAFSVAPQLNNSGWMEVNTHQEMYGLAFLGGGSAPILMADIPFISKLSSCLVVPHIAQDNNWDTEILICNPNPENVSVSLIYVDKAGAIQGVKNDNILPHGSGAYLLSEVFNDKVPLAGRIEINSSSGLAAFALYTDKKSGGTYYAGINADSCE